MIKQRLHWYMNRLYIWVKSLFKPKMVPAASIPTAETKPFEYTEWTYKTELQIVQRNEQIICTDFIYKMNNMLNPSYNLLSTKYDPVKIYIDESFNQGIMHTFDKSNKHHTAIATVDIKRILYKPCEVVVLLKKE